MATWNGWQADLLVAAGVPNTSRNRAFLTAWKNSHPTACYRNPVVISHRQPGSTNCQKLPNVDMSAQNYLSVSSGKAAFGQQLNSAPYSWLLKAFQSGDPWSFHGDTATVVAQQLYAWGSPKFSQDYARQQQQTTGTLNAPQALHGWADLRKSINRGMPAALTYSQTVTTKTLRTLAAARKVKL